MIHIVDKQSNHHLFPKENLISINTAANGNRKASAYGKHSAVLYNILVRYRVGLETEVLTFKDYEYCELERLVNSIKR